MTTIAGHAGSSAGQRLGDQPRRPAEVVESTELLYRQIFSAGLLAALLTTLGAAALAGLHTASSAHRLQTIAATLSVAAALALLLLGRRCAYRALRRRPPLLLLVGSALAGVGVVAGSTGQHLFYVVTLILGVLGVATPLRTVVASGIVAAAVPPLVLGNDLALSAASAVPMVLIPVVFWVIVELLARFLASAYVPGGQRLLGRGGRAGRGSRTPRATRRQQRHLPIESSSAVDLPGDDEPHSSVRLTARQLQVLLLCCEGLNHLEVADCLELHPQQVRRHLRSARERAGVRTTPQLVAWAVSQGLIPNDEGRMNAVLSN